MRVIYGFMFLTMCLVALELIRNLQWTKTCIRLALAKIEKLKEILKDYGDN
jgi:hypothetical protein